MGGRCTVATRALEIWSVVVVVVEHFQALPSSRRPLNNKFDDILVKDHKDNSIKFRFFIDIANILAPFLKQFQTDDPVMPFMDEVLATIIGRIMKIFPLRSVVNDVVTSHHLIKLDITRKGFFYHNLLLSCQLHQKLWFPLWKVVVVKS